MEKPFVPLWKEAPFLRLAPLFCLGILLQSHWNFAGSFLLSGLLLPISLLLMLANSPLPVRYRWRHLQAAAWQLLYVLAGCLAAYARDPASHPDWIKLRYHPGDCLLLILEETPSKRTRSLRVSCTAKILGDSGRLINCSGKIQLYLQPDSMTNRLRRGDRMLTCETLRPILNQGNPGGFNYAAYAYREGKYFQLYLSSKGYLLMPSAGGCNFRSWLDDIHEWIRELLYMYIPGREGFGLAEALLLGYKEDLDSDLKSSYSQSGVIHVIAISGLHLGLIYLILRRLFQFLQRRKKLRWLRLALILSGLWFFALLTGASPSVLRSAFMFSLLLLGETRKNPASAFNSLAAAAFFLLCHQPAWIFAAGFQLSFSAVLGILIFQRPLSSLLFTPHAFLYKVWQISTVTISAQALTFPLSIYHFHQFPNYFLPANLLVVPLSSLILSGELILCFISWIPWMAQWLGRAIGWAIFAMNRITGFTASLPNSISENLYFSTLTVLLIYLMLAGAGRLWLHKSRAGCWIILIAAHCLLAESAITKLQESRRTRLLVYQLPEGIVLDFIEGNRYQTVEIEPGGSLSDNNKLTLQKARLSQGIRETAHLPSLLHQPPLIQFAGQRILIANGEEFNGQESAAPLQANLLVISPGSRPDPKQLFKSVHCQRVIIPSCLPGRQQWLWKQACERAGLPCYAVVENGAFVLPLR